MGWGEGGTPDFIIIIIIIVIIIVVVVVFRVVETRVKRKTAFPFEDQNTQKG